MISTIYGPMDLARLLRRDYTENGVHYVEYYLGIELVHRSAAVALTGLQATGIAKI